MHATDSQEQASHQPKMFTDSVTGTSNNTDQVFVHLKVTIKGRRPPRETPFKLDTGAKVNILTLKAYRQLGEPELEPTTQNLFSYSGDRLDIIGQCSLQCQYKNMSPQVLDFYVVDTRCASVLGLQACLSLQLIQLILPVE